MSTDALEQAFSSTSQILANVKPDQLGDPTPCQSWDVRALTNHIVGGAHWFALCNDAGRSPEQATTEDSDYTAGDVMDAYRDATAKAVASFRADGALDRIVSLPFGDMPGHAFLALATCDAFVHGWDLAHATGQAVELDQGLAAAILAQAQGMIPDAIRGPDGQAPFGPAVDAPADAPAADRLAAFLGRTPPTA